ncbi:signal peptidase I [Subtercola boreus]|uniref:Signal peptidase I n=1 Tax=Subtercola boreus TaxID=120213 RepID=A0A3E0VSV0_9MICO|nr:LamG domain-containing protein [Subtercola boreus]RFA13094.1 signal peptidase I [Subtercola boreus]
MSGDTPATRPLTTRHAWAGALLALLLVGVFAVTWFTPGTSSAYSAKITNNTDTAATAANFTCTGAYAVDKANALFQYPLTEATGATTATDTSGAAANGTYQGAMTASGTTPIACPRDAGTSYVLNGSTSYLSTPTQVTSPPTFTLETWFKTSTPSGKLVGFESLQTGTSGQYDRQVYLSPTGQVIFGTYNGGTQVITSPAGYANGAWHHVVATFSAGTGMNLYLDGAPAASNTAFTTAEAHAGYWRFGQGNLNGWPNAGTNSYVTGTLRYAAVYTTALTQTQITNHYAAGH